MHESLAILEIDSLPRAVAAHDAALKRGHVQTLACAPVSPGKVVLVFAGAVAEVEEAFGAAVQMAGSTLIGQLLLSAVHPAVVTALSSGGELAYHPTHALLVLEYAHATAAVSAADAACKAAHVQLGRLHLATGFGGRAFFTLSGEQVDLEAAQAAAQSVALRDAELIARPHSELAAGLLTRPWPMDPSRGG